MIDVSIVIVNYHTEKLLVECIYSIIEKTEGLKYEIIVVDNDPSRGLKRILAEDVFLENISNVTYIGLPDNPGFGGANNEAFKVAKGKFIFCLNPDTLLINNAIGILYDYMLCHPECGACGGNLYHEDMKTALSLRRILPGIFWEISERFRRHPERLLYGRNTRFNHTKHPIEVGYITGADLMLRKDIIDNIGGFSLDYFMYFEETDLCARIHRSGYRVISVPDAKIIHLEGKSFEKDSVNETKLKYYEYSRAVYYRRNVEPEVAEKAHRIYLNGLRKASCRKDVRGTIACVRLKYAQEALLP